MLKPIKSLIERVNRNSEGQSSFHWEFIGVQIFFGYIWLMGGYEKIVGGTFVPGLAKTLGVFASKNPFSWYVSYLNNIAIPNAALLGQLVQWGELLAGVMVLFGALVYFISTNIKLRRWLRCGMIIALAGMCLMNANFYFAAGWMSASTHTVNVLMFWVELIFLLSWINMKVKK